MPAAKLKGPNVILNILQRKTIIDVDDKSDDDDENDGASAASAASASQSPLF